MKVRSLLLASLFVGAVAACDNNPSKDKSQAAVAQPLAPTSVPAEAVRYPFSQEDSKIEFVAAKVTRKHDGSFGTFSGNMFLVGNAPEKSSVTAEIDVSSIKTDSEKLTGHLKTAELLDVAKYPKAKFTSTSIRPGGEKGATHTVTGNFELHGVTKSISFPATIKVAGDAIAVDAEFAINRKDFGILYPGAPDDLIKDDVLMKLHLRANAKKAS